MSDTVIHVEHVGKRYRIGRREQYRTLRESVTGLAASPFRALGGGGRLDEGNSFWALKDVSFEVGRGEVVGIIGRNGAGKSTLLKVLSQITEPTEGRVVLDGRVGSLLEVGTGFHPELTGRENVYLNGAILGMTRAEIAGKFDEIVAFSEVEKFLDTPVKQYSSGMYTRLAFAVAANLEPEILIVDEVLAVGDQEFQKKCLGKMNEVAHQGRTVLFVSHNMAAVRNLCGRSVLLNAGRVESIGPTAEVVELYLRGDRAAPSDLLGRTDREGTGVVRVERLTVLGEDGEPTSRVVPGRPWSLRLGFRSSAPSSVFQVSADLDTADGGRVTTLFSGFQGDVFRTEGGRATVDCTVEAMDLRPDVYTLNVWVGLNRTEVFDFVHRAAVVEFQATDFYDSGHLPEKAHGPLMARFRWRPGPPDRGDGEGASSARAAAAVGA